MSFARIGLLTLAQFSRAYPTVNLPSTKTAVWIVPPKGTGPTIRATKVKAGPKWMVALDQYTQDNPRRRASRGRRTPKPPKRSRRRPESIKQILRRTYYGPARKNPPHSERLAWGKVREIARKVAKKDFDLASQLEEISWAMLQQLKAGVHENPALAVLGNPPDGVTGTIAKRVYQIKYQHAQDGKNYKHDFGPGVRCTLLKDGRAVIWHPSKPVWQDFPE